MWSDRTNADITEVTVITETGDLTLANAFLHPMSISDPTGAEGGPAAEAGGATGGTAPPPPRIGGPSSRISLRDKHFVSLADEKRREFVEEAIISAVVLLHATMRSARLLHQRGVGPDSAPIGEFTYAGVNVSTSLAVLVPLDEHARQLPAADKATLHDLRLATKFPQQAIAASAHDLRIAPFLVVGLPAAIEWAHCMWSRSLPSRARRGHPVLGRYSPLVHGRDLGLCADSPIIIFMLQPDLADTDLSRRLPAHSEESREWLATVVNSGMHKAHLRANNRPSRALTSAIGGAPILRELQHSARFRHRGVRRCPNLLLSWHALIDPMTTRVCATKCGVVWSMAADVCCRPRRTWVSSCITPQPW